MLTPKARGESWADFTIDMWYAVGPLNHGLFLATAWLEDIFARRFA